MQYVTHRPAPPLSAFVESIWYYQAPELRDGLERILPTGTMSLHVNLAEDELRWYESAELDRCRRLNGTALCGAYAEHFAIDLAEQRDILGVEFTPAGAYPFFGPPADELSSTHVPLDALWGRDAALLRERVLEAPTARDKLHAAEAMLYSRLVRSPERDPAIDFALGAFGDPDGRYAVSDVTARLGMTPKRFIQCFAARVGLTPKRFCRVQRFQQAIAVVQGGGRASWTDIALDSGYYDQAHFIHDFRAFAGMTPTEYVNRRRERNHVPIE